MWWLILAAVILGVLHGAAGADTGALVDEAEREGIDLLYAGLAALATAVAGWLAKRPQDIARDRKAAQEGTQAPPAQGKAHEVEDELKEHLRDCKEYRREMREELRRLYGRMDEVAGDVRYIKGRMDGQPQRG